MPFAWSRNISNVTNIFGVIETRLPNWGEYLVGHCEGSCAEKATSREGAMPAFVECFTGCGWITPIVNPGVVWFWEIEHVPCGGRMHRVYLKVPWADFSFTYEFSWLFVWVPHKWCQMKDKISNFIVKLVGSWSKQSKVDLSACKRGTVEIFSLDPSLMHKWVWCVW